jgi:hypothetical protein
MSTLDEINANIVELREQVNGVLDDIVKMAPDLGEFQEAKTSHLLMMVGAGYALGTVMPGSPIPYAVGAIPFGIMANILLCRETPWTKKITGCGHYEYKAAFAVMTMFSLSQLGKGGAVRPL